MESGFWAVLMVKFRVVILLCHIACEVLLLLVVSLVEGLFNPDKM